MISKKILSEVLGYTPYKIDSVKKVSGVGLTLILLNEDNTVRAYWNIYELMNKCKQWIYEKYIKDCVDAYIETSIYMNTASNKEYRCLVYKYNNDTEDEISKCFYANTEPDAVFEACEWLYEELEYRREI